MRTVRTSFPCTMEMCEPGKVFIDTLLIGPSDASEIAENHDDPDEEDVKDD